MNGRLSTTMRRSALQADVMGENVLAQILHKTENVLRYTLEEKRS
jgi:hypothetical protein